MRCIEMEFSKPRFTESKLIHMKHFKTKANYYRMEIIYYLLVIFIHVFVKMITDICMMPLLYICVHMIIQGSYTCSIS